MAHVIEATDPHAKWTTMGWRSVLNVFLCGVIVGAVTYILYLLLERFVFTPLLCSSSMAVASCSASSEFANGIALIAGSLLGLVLLVRERVYRPMLAVIGVIISLWGIMALLAGLPWFALLIAAALLFGVSYVLYSWIAQPTNVFVAIGATLVLAVVTRIMLAL